MSQIIKASIGDVPLLAGYLRDATFLLEDLSFDHDSAMLTLKLERICHERQETGRALLFFKIIRFPWIKAELAISCVIGVAQKRDRERQLRPGDRHMLLDLESESGIVTLRSQSFSVRIMHESGSVITIRDFSDPLPQRRLASYGKSSFVALEEVNKLRIEADSQQSPEIAAQTAPCCD